MNVKQRDLECPICLDILDNPVSTDCSHVFCKSCIEDWMLVQNKETCPCCNNEITGRMENTWLRRQIDNLPETCEFKECSWNGPRKDRQAHQANCEYRIEPCAFCSQQMMMKHIPKHERQCSEAPIRCKDCNKTLLRKDLSDHLENQCSRRIVVCSMCSKEKMFKDLHAHQLECPEREVFCNHCKEQLKVRELADHKKVCHLWILECKYCSKSLRRQDLEEHEIQCVIPCPFAVFGCSVLGYGAEMKDHVEEFQIQHLAMQNKKMLELAMENKKTLQTHTKMLKSQSKDIKELQVGEPKKEKSRFQLPRCARPPNTFKRLTTFKKPKVRLQVGEPKKEKKLTFTFGKPKVREKNPFASFGFGPRYCRD